MVVFQRQYSNEPTYNFARLMDRQYPNQIYKLLARDSASIVCWGPQASTPAATPFAWARRHAPARLGLEDLAGGDSGVCAVPVRSQSRLDSFDISELSLLALRNPPDPATCARRVPRFGIAAPAGRQKIRREPQPQRLSPQVCREPPRHGPPPRTKSMIVIIWCIVVL